MNPKLVIGQSLAPAPKYSELQSSKPGDSGLVQFFDWTWNNNRLNFAALERQIEVQSRISWILCTHKGHTRCYVVYISILLWRLLAKISEWERESKLRSNASPLTTFSRI
ncbi:hypothetical protein Nepgr_013458 [Nepenthes gracilis]|uniref:Uncharacterized protein n=1 Tax=Nepenthes gracilis TaxID=150966 RepID=A0AAD3SI67_NEPGR|nr:hypothetical protein Nepgr_013458 [Nepenthes gracilis]